MKSVRKTHTQRFIECGSPEAGSTSRRDLWHLYCMNAFILYTVGYVKKHMWLSRGIKPFTYLLTWYLLPIESQKIPPKVTTPSFLRSVWSRRFLCFIMLYVTRLRWSVLFDVAAIFGVVRSPMRFLHVTTLSPVPNWTSSLCMQCARLLSLAWKNFENRPSFVKVTNEWHVFTHSELYPRPKFVEQSLKPYHCL